MDIKAIARDTLVKLLKIKPEELQDDVQLTSGIGVDSTEMVEYCIALEKAFNIKVTPKEVTKYSTMNEIEQTLKQKLKA